MHAYALKHNNNRPAWAQAISGELDEVESQLASIVSSDVQVAGEISASLIRAGGKRLRPSLVVLSTLATGGNTDERAISIACAAELVHSASLVHDDVIDETKVRRGEDTANSVWGNKVSVLAGDYLLSKAFGLLASVRDEKILSLFSQTAVKMSESELLQATAEGDFARWKKDYLNIISGKTAAFFSTCSLSGAILSWADDITQKRLSDYGHNLGLAFQITDDVLDIAGDPDVTGKDAATDMQNGKYTLPVIYAAEEDPSIAESLSGMLSAEEAKSQTEKIRKTTAIERSRKTALDYSNHALADISFLPESDYKSSLELVARQLAERNS